MVVSETSSGSGHCGWAREVVLGAASSARPVRQSLLPFEDGFSSKQNEWVASRAQQQLLWDTLQSLKDKAARAFVPIDVGQPLDPFRETYSDGGLYGAGCNYAVGFHGIQGRQAKCEDYVLHLALGPDLFTPFDNCTRACLACVLDGHGGTGAVQYVAERFPAYLLADLPRLRAHPASAMRSALHRIDEELTALGHNSGTTVNALMLIDNRITVVNTGDCRCILYDWVDERAVQVTHDHNLHSSRERERVLGEGAELSNCGSYVVLPCPTDGAKLLGVTKALGHAGVKALQRSFTMGSLSGILEAELGGDGDDKQQQQGQLEEPPQALQLEVSPRMDVPSDERVVAVRGLAVAGAAMSLSPCGLWSDHRDGCGGGEGVGGAGAGAGGGGAASGSGMSEDFPVLPSSAVHSGGEGLPDMDTCSSCPALVESCRGLSGATTAAAARMAGGQQHRGQHLAESPVSTAVSPCVAEFDPPAAPAPRQQHSLASAPGGQQTGVALPPQQHQSSFATPAAMILAAAVAATPHCRAASGRDLLCPSAAAAAAAAAASCGAAPLAGVLTGASLSSGGGFLLTCEPDDFEFTVEDDRHLILLGCDGVFDRMNNTEACRTAVRQLTSSNSCTDAAREVAHRACRLGSLDNITALVLRVGRKPIVRRQSFSVLRRSASNTSDLAASGGSITSRA